MQFSKTHYDASFEFTCPSDGESTEPHSANPQPGQAPHVNSPATPQPGRTPYVDLFSSAKIMIVDDDRLGTIEIAGLINDAGITNVRSTTDLDRAIDYVRHERPDIVLLDVSMEDANGFAILKSMRSDVHLESTPVVVLSQHIDSQTKLASLELGACGFIAKPVASDELVVSIRNILAEKSYHDHLAYHSNRLQDEVRQRMDELEQAHREAENARQEAIHCLARAAEFRDDDTGHHVIRVGKYAAIIARRLGWAPERIQVLEQAAQMHDVGKIGISDTILLKPGKLTDEEFETMKTHCEIGGKIICPKADQDWYSLRNQVGEVETQPASPVMQMAAVIASTHHEKWDGSGYPNGLAGRDIPIEGRITAVADVYDALSSERPYKEAYPKEKCFAILREGSGKHFDPNVIDAFFAGVTEILRVQRILSEPK